MQFQIINQEITVLQRLFFIHVRSMIDYRNVPGFLACQPAASNSKGMEIIGFGVVESYYSRTRSYGQLYLLGFFPLFHE